MSQKKSERIKKQKEEIISFAEKATKLINENNTLLFTIEKYSNFLDQIKEILNIKNDKNYSEKEKTEIVLQKISSYFSNLNKMRAFLSDSVDKLQQKSDINYSLIFDENSTLKMELARNQADNFILSNELRQKADNITKLKESLKSSKDHSLFREIKRETNSKCNEANPYLISENMKLQRDLIIDCKNTNKYKVKVWKKERLMYKKKDLISCLNDIIKFFEESVSKTKQNASSNVNKTNVNKSIFNSKKKKIPYNSKNKIPRPSNNVQNYTTTLDTLSNRYNFINENYSSVNMNYYNDNGKNKSKLRSSLYKSVNLKQTDYIHNNSKQIRNNSASKSKNNPYKEDDKNDKKVKIKNKFEFLTVDELFDLDNVETVKEAIIDDELHSDDEVVFGDKVKPKKSIRTDYIEEIKKQVPRLYFSQIEFNKAKVMNEADLYSAQRRKFEMQNIDENLKTLKKKIKKIKKKCKYNQEKLEAMKNYDEILKDNYKILKPLKVTTSVSDVNVNFMKNVLYNYKPKNAEIEEVDENISDGDIGYDIDDENKIDNVNDFNKMGKIQTENNYKDVDYYKSGIIHVSKKSRKKVESNDLEKQSKALSK